MHLPLVYIVCVILVIFNTSCFCDILVIDNNSSRTVEIFGDLPALFGPPLPSGGLKGYVVYTTPPDGCTKLKPPPHIKGYDGPFIALIRRYNCTFVNKVLNAQSAGYKAVIVRNVGSNSVVMNGDINGDSVHIPSVFIGQDDGILIEHNFLYNSGYHVLITDDLPFDLKKYLLPFAVTVGICFILMLVMMVVKCFRDYKKTRRHRLSYRALRKLPTHKFKKGDPYECCAVCLEDYVDNDKLRILPCQHAYHSKCIDPWLTKNRRVCPVCKRKVLTGDERASDLETDSEDEASPLINSEGGTQGGTFSEQRDNPFQEAERLMRERQRGRGRIQRNPARYGRLSEEEEEEEISTDSDEDAANANVRVHSSADPVEFATTIDRNSEENDESSDSGSCEPKVVIYSTDSRQSGYGENSVA